KTGKSIEEFKLRGASSRNHPGGSVCFYRFAQDCSSLFGGRLGHFAFVIEAPYYHVEILPSPFPGYPVARFFAAIAITMQSATGTESAYSTKGALSLRVGA